MLVGKFKTVAQLSRIFATLTYQATIFIQIRNEIIILDSKIVLFLQAYSIGLAINYTLICKKKCCFISLDFLVCDSHKCFTKMMLSALYMLNNIRAVIKMPNCKSNKTLFSNNNEENCFLFTAWHVDFSSLGLSPFG